MRRILITLLLFSCCNYFYAQDCFRLSPEKSRSAEELHLGKVFSKDEIIYPFKEKSLSSISITGCIDVLRDDYLVRVIVSDTGVVGTGT